MQMTVMMVNTEKKFKGFLEKEVKWEERTKIHCKKKKKQCHDVWSSSRGRAQELKFGDAKMKQVGKLYI